MQKKIIALAIAAAFSAPAFADSTVYGVVDAAVVSKSVTNQKSDLLALSGALASSRLGVKSVEDLDSGLKAVAVVEYGLDTQTADGVGNARQEMLALAGGFGTVATGYLQTAGYDWQVKYDPTAGSAVSPLTDVNSGFLIGSGALGKRAPRALAYISPDMGGLTVAVNYSTSLYLKGVLPGPADLGNDAGNLGIASNVNTGLKWTAMLLSANYAAGPLSVGGVYASAKDTSNNGVTVTDVSLGGSYDLGVAKLFATYQTNKTDAAGAKTDNAISMSAVVPVGPGAIAASFAKNDIKSTAGDDNTTALSLVYLQGLSKSTTLYAAYNSITQKAASDIKTSIVAVGLKKAF